MNKRSEAKRLADEALSAIDNELLETHESCCMTLCEWEAITKRGERCLCAQCAEAFDAGEHEGHQTGATGKAELLKICNEAQAAIDILAEDIADSYPSRAENATDLAMRLRALIHNAGGAN